MKSVRWLWALLFILLIVVATASAETRQGSISVTPMIGGYVFEGNQDVENDTVFGYGVGYGLTDRWAAEVGFNFVGAETETTNTDVDLSLFHLDFLYHFDKFYRFEPFVAFGLGAIDVDPEFSDSDTDFMANYGVGLKYFLTESLALRGDVRHIVAFNGDTDNNLAYTFGISYLFENKAKAVTPAPTPAPTPTPAPVPAPPIDSDGDGVIDDLDKCPDTPAGAPIDKDGCPLDTDGDGVPDFKDDCANTPMEAAVNDRGCWIIEMLLFDIDKADIKSVSFPGLDNVEKVLMKNASMRLEIEGHTDNTGTKTYNQVLSEKRANAVLKYLIEKGVDKERLSSKGYGFSRPAATNDTAEGRSKNRRVELKPIQ